MIKTHLVDPLSGKNARITKNLGLLVSDDGLPPQLEKTSQRAVPRLAQFADSSGNTDMRADGSVTPVQFSVKADLQRDYYVRKMSIVISDAGAALNEFGNIGVLTNGIDLFWERDTETIELLGLKLFTNFDFIYLAAGDPAFGTGTNSFRAPNVSGPSEAFLPTIDFATRFGMPYGILLQGGTNERLVFQINDDITGVDRFDALTTGFLVEELS